MVGGRNRKERRNQRDTYQLFLKFFFISDPFLYRSFLIPLLRHQSPSGSYFSIPSSPTVSRLAIGYLCSENGWVWGKVGVDGDGQMVCLGTIRGGTKRYD